MIPSVNAPACDATLDARGLKCPLPVLKAGRMLRSLKPGQVLQLLATDKASIHDVPDFCIEAGYTLLASFAGDGEHRFFIRKETA